MDRFCVRVDFFKAVLRFQTRRRVLSFRFNSTGPDTTTPTEPTEPSEPEPPATSFADVPAGIWYEDAMAWAVENGLIQGGTDGRLSPLGTATRAQAVTVLLRYCKLLDK